MITPMEQAALNRAEIHKRRQQKEWVRKHLQSALKNLGAIRDNDDPTHDNLKVAVRQDALATYLVEKRKFPGTELEASEALNVLRGDRSLSSPPWFGWVGGSKDRLNDHEWSLPLGLE